MEKPRRWHLFLILAVIVLTLYNILPTVFYYGHPLKKSVSQKEASVVAQEIVERVNGLEGFTLSWLKAELKNLKLKAEKVYLDETNPKIAYVEFASEKEANFFSSVMQRAGALISFAPAELGALVDKADPKKVAILRKIPVHLTNDYFRFVSKKEPEYLALIEARKEELSSLFRAPSPLSKSIHEGEETLRVARAISEIENNFEGTSLAKRLYASFEANPTVMQQFLTSLKQAEEKYSALVKNAKDEEEEILAKNNLQTIESAHNAVQNNLSSFEAGKSFFNPFVEKISIDWNKETIEIALHPDIEALLTKEAGSEKEALAQETLKKMLFNEMGKVSRESGEKIEESLSHFTVVLCDLKNSSSLLLLDLQKVAKEEGSRLFSFLEKNWHPEFELSKGNFPWNVSQDNSLGLVFYAPVLDKSPKEGFESGSVYVIAKGLAALVKKYQDLPESAEKARFNEDLASLGNLMQQNGYVGYWGGNSALSEKYKNDLIFELPDSFSYLIAATREDFSMKSTKNIALLEFTDLEQRTLALNKIETAEQEDLLRWKDEYKSVSVSLDARERYDVPKPTKNAFLNNLVLSTKKYFRGDDRKILRWGLDLSGGKTVRIGLKDQNGNQITEEADLKQATSELYQRINRLGLAEVNIKQEGETIVLDFPGTQGLSATDLVKASAMYFHVVNEKFTAQNSSLKEAVNAFLEEVWNEAIITNRKDPEGIGQIAWEHLGGSIEHEKEFYPKTPHAKILYEQGLRLHNPKMAKRSSTLDETMSQVGLLRGDNFTAWQGQTYPLLIVFSNFALQGSDLADIHTGYDPKEGNLLNFNVRAAYSKEGERFSPRDDLYAWTSQFSEEGIAGTSRESISQGRGWRMAVLLNGTVVSAPTLNSALRDSARITGHFTQREINTLAADLRAGSLSFTPYILAEENVSPELGKEQRMQGIWASLIGILLVAGLMCVYYRFGGLVATVAVIFNLLIIWAVLQNLSAALTLAGIAGIILTVGMAVDANVLVFERIREEFAKHGKLSLAIHTGYKKAFSAIVDSNLTTIIAALILLNFDAGPIKGFALTLIIGIVSSMFTSLFMTRFFFSKWVQNPEHKSLKMAKLFNNTSFDFLSRAKGVIVASLLIMAVGLFMFVKERSTLFGMDFTGGYALTLTLEEKPNTPYRLLAQKGLEESGISSGDFQIQELTKPNQLRLQLSTALEEPGQPFHNIDEKKGIENPLFAYQHNPRIVWIVSALERQGLQLSPLSQERLHLAWNEMSGQLSDTMRTQALFGLALAFLAILIYITIRFEFQYAISATIALLHDVLITIALLALLHLVFPDLRIDLQVVAALMTIVGYSLNDTIIIFDRIREDLKLHRRTPFKQIVNNALNSTLSRTMMTSGTTLVVLLALVFLGGQSIFNFSLILTLGVAVGTLSSLYVATPLLVYFHEKRFKNGEKAVN